MGRRSENATLSVEQANAAGNALQTITESVSLISDMNTQIATAAEEQSANDQKQIFIKINYLLCKYYLRFRI